MHRAAFPDSALTKLGAGAVRRYYEWQLTGPHEVIALGLWLGGQLAGYCIGGRFRGQTSGFVRKHLLYLCLCAALRPRLLLRAQYRLRVDTALKCLGTGSRRRATQVSEPRSRTRSFGVLALAVHPDQQRRGLGNTLMNQVEVAAREQGYQAMHLTVHPSNLKAVGFYEAQGWQRQDTGPAEWTGRMTKSLV